MPLELKPYKETDVSWERSKGLITGMLMEFGATGVQWTHIFERNEINFRFSYMIEEKGVENQVVVQILAPIRMPVKEDSYGDIVEVTPKERKKAMNQAYRAVFWWIKSSFEAVAFGIQRIEEVFLSHMLYKLPDGRQTTVGRAFEAGIIQKAEFQLEAPDVELLPPEKEK